MSGGKCANISWTLLTPEEIVTETLRPLAEGTLIHEESFTSEAGSRENQPASGAESIEELSVEGHQVSEDKTAARSGGTSKDQPASEPTTVADVPVLTTLEGTAIFASGNDAFSQSKDLPKGQEQSTPDPDTFSESYTHMTPSSVEQPSTPLSTENLEGVDFTQQEERIAQEGLNAQCLLQEDEVSDMTPMIPDVVKPSDSPVDSGVGEQRTQKTAEEGEPEFRRRRSLLAALEPITKSEKEEEEEEEFRLPQQEEDSRFSLNKCILGALILLGLGTIFFSVHEESDYGTRGLKDAAVQGNKEWLDPEVSSLSVEADTTHLLNKLAKVNQQMSLLQAEMQTQKEELNVAKGQAAEGVETRLRLEEVEKENSWLKKKMASLPDLQKENDRMKKELESVLALQKEPETQRSTAPDLKVYSPAGVAEGVGAIVDPTTSPSSGQLQDSMQGTAGSTERLFRKPLDKQSEKKKDKTERKKPDWKEVEHKDGGKSEWKKEKHDQEKFDKERKQEAKQKWHSDETKQWKEEKWKKEKTSRGDEGKQWKDREGKKEWKGRSDRREWLEEKKTKHEEVGESKRWKGREERKDWKVRKEHEDEQKGREEWNKGKEGYKESGKYKLEKKDRKEKGEKKEWKKDGDRTSKNVKVHSKDGKWKGESKQWEENTGNRKEMMQRDERRRNEKSKLDKCDKVLKRKDERGEWNERKSKHDKKSPKQNLRKDLNDGKSENGRIAKEWKRKDEGKEWGKKEEQLNKGGRREIKDWTGAGENSHKHKNENKSIGHHGHKEEQVWGDRKPTHTHRKPSTDQPEYWLRQRQRLQHNPKPAHHHKSVETFAQAEGLVPVPLEEFEVILQGYLAKAEESGVDVSIREELKKLASQYFKDGVFVHDQMSFQDFAEDLGDVLEDIVERDDDEDEEGSAKEEEMEEFEKVVIKRFSMPEAGEKENRSKGKWRKESGRGHG